VDQYDEQLNNLKDRAKNVGMEDYWLTIKDSLDLWPQWKEKIIKYFVEKIEHCEKADDDTIDYD
jgi:hypothetical protein